jgi:type I restriction enzyme R subunit
VRIYYESRLAKVNLSEEGKQLVEKLDDELAQDDLTESQKAKAKWTQLEAQKQLECWYRCFQSVSL